MVAWVVALLLLCVAAPLRVAGDKAGGTTTAPFTDADLEWLREDAVITGAWNEPGKDVQYESACRDAIEEVCGLLCPAVLQTSKAGSMKNASDSRGGACTKAEETNHPYLQIAVRGILCKNHTHHSLDFTWTQDKKSSVWMKPDGIRTRQVLSLIYLELKDLIKEKVPDFTLCLATGGFAPSLDLEGGTRIRVHVIGAKYEDLRAANQANNKEENMQDVFMNKIRTQFEDKGEHKKGVLINVHKNDPLRFAEISLPKIA